MINSKEEKMGGVLLGCNIVLFFVLSFVYTIATYFTGFNDFVPGKSLSWNIMDNYEGIIYEWEWPMLLSMAATILVSLIFHKKVKNIWMLARRIMWLSWLLIILIERTIHYIF